MPSHAYWSGLIKLSLVTIPVQVVSATKAVAKISFHQVHRPSGSRIRYQKIVPGVGPVEDDDIVRGYEVEKGKYVLLTDEEIDDIKLTAKKVIDLVQFVDIGEIDPIYFDRPFFVLPDEDSDAEAFVVLRDALRKSGKLGLGQIVLRGRGAVVAVKACGKGLMLETLRYADEVKKAESAFRDVPDIEPKTDLVELAEELIRRNSKTFNPADFSDTYESALHELIEAKAEHRQVRAIEQPQQGAKVIDLMEALRRSVGRGREGKGKGKGKGKAKPAPRRKSPSKAKRAAGKRQHAA